MLFPRKSTVRIYCEKKYNSFLLVIDENGRNYAGMWECYANVHADDTPSLCVTSCSSGWLRGRCKRVQWSDLPKIWQKAFLVTMKDWDITDPKQIKGFWKTDKYWIEN